MSVKVSLQNVKAVQAMLRAFGPGFAIEARQALDDAGREFVEQFAGAHLSGRGAESVGVGTGGLKRSFGHRVTGFRLDRLALALGFGPPAHPWMKASESQARTHLKGGGVGTIKPKQRKYLVIPLNRTKAGVRRGLWITELGVDIVWVRRSPGATNAKRFRAPLDPTKAYAFPRRGGPGWVVTYGGKPMFLLVPSVRVPERLPLHEKFLAFRSRLVDHLEAARNRAVARAQGGTGA